MEEIKLLERNLYTEDHEMFRATVGRFFDDEIVPRHDAWEEQGFVDRDVWDRAGELGLLCATMPEEYGGSGVDRKYSAILLEEQGYRGINGVGFALHSDIVAPYINNYGSEELKKAFLPDMATGKRIGAIAMTEPDTGSDLQAIKTTAKEDGDDFIINGAKTYITNGWNCDFAIVACKTGETGGAKEMSLVIVEADRDGFHKDKPFKKVGMRAQDTCQLTFDNVRVPKSNLLGGPNMAFMMLMTELAWERLMIAIGCVAGAHHAFRLAHEYSQERKAFGRPIGAFQNSRFKLAEMKTEIAIGQTYVDRCLELCLDNKLSVEAAAAAKYWTSDMLQKVVDEAVQLHGGYGYMWETPIARAYADARVQRIYGGSTEIMKEIISRSL
ncbi:MAG: acyl-CoA dehydrogenase family protein [Pseudomonadota bacterium]